MKSKHNNPSVSGIRFLDPRSGKDRRTLSASLRGGRHAVSGDTASFDAEPIDTSEVVETVVCAPATLRLAEELFERWNSALESGDARRVGLCYAEDAVLLPTVSNVPRLSRREIQEYFEHFLQKQPVGKIDQRNVKFGCNKITDAGIYTFRIINDGKTEYVPARYTFVYENRDGDWLIAHHHSSLMPTS
ncbi:SgcJ/EcaC family oxidoreductase [Marichromatium purpuratum]|uniref:SgcJ/EcaC family oxidoreductase n=1 Tax=Marichromatium purpuratum TaxID=37487 RepID=UPI00021E6B51|nr:SgcJ/EcaC family oxidoreductase [Marichromatium purpuratum]